MATNSFMPRQEGDRIDWFINFAAKLPSYANKYNVTAEQVADVVAGAAFTSQWYYYKLALDAHKQQVTKYNDEQMNGSTASVAPVPPTLPTLAAPPAGVLARAVAIGKTIKAQHGFAEADGKDMGLIGTQVVVDPESMKPTLALRIVGGGHPEIVWQKYDMDGVEIHKEGADGTFALLAYDTYPNYTDTTPLPAAGLSAVWRYKAIYKFKDAQAGQWSDVASVNVMGV
jgi:hypothetical protein